MSPEIEDVCVRICAIKSHRLCFSEQNEKVDDEDIGDEGGLPHQTSQDKGHVRQSGVCVTTRAKRSKTRLGRLDSVVSSVSGASL